MKSSLKNMVLVLFCITLVSAACVGLVNMITVDPIAKAKEAAEKAALAQVLPAFDATEMSEHEADELAIVAYKATKDGEVVGYAVKTATKNGFSGMVKMMVGFDTKGTILNVNVLEQNETPGLGAKMTEEGNPLLASVQGKDAAKVNFTVKKDGGDIDALTAATISSRAYADAVARAYAVFKVAAGWSDDVEATSGATQTKEE
ncbi:MAG: RnfABCDGE type electron transport complex subunit G [Alistipes sp.]|nr:RnfABCDGE type electron transport complex subunit G [Alistipes sp.]